MKLFFHLCKSIFIAVIFCLLLEHFGIVTFCRDFQLKGFLDKHLFVHMTTQNIDKIDEKFDRLTDHLRDYQTQIQLQKQKSGVPDQRKANSNYRETI